MKRTDANQAEIVKALRDVGASVLDLHEIGNGCPDLLVGHRGFTYLIEVKTEKGKLNDYQIGWFNWWRGTQPIIVHTVDQALAAIGIGETVANWRPL